MSALKKLSSVDWVKLTEENPSRMAGWSCENNF
jgi:hypothetical protein